eukprot:1513711-Prymnesium_polylepis.1
MHIPVAVAVESAKPRDAILRESCSSACSRCVRSRRVRWRHVLRILLLGRGGQNPKDGAHRGAHGAHRGLPG